MTTAIKHHGHFKARPKAGQKQRIGSGTYEEKVNRQQRKLVRVYDQWLAGVKREIAARAKRGATLPELSAYLDGQVPRLEARLTEIMNVGTQSAIKTATGSRAELPAIVALGERQMNENVAMVRDNLIPKLHEKLTLAIAAAVPAFVVGSLAIQQQQAVALAIKNASLASRAMPAQYAGGYWVAVFEAQQTLGGVREDERKSQGLDPEPVKWNLDPRAVHCLPSAGFYGCPELAKEYPSWRALPTVPAGQVTCRGNCRCHLTVLRDGQWQRGVYDD